MRVGFIGLGKLGMPCAEEMAKAGHIVRGFDIIDRTSDLIEIQNTIQETVNDVDLVFIAVPTPHDSKYGGEAPTAHLKPKDFDYSIVIDCLIEANEYMNKNQLLVLISTVLPGTTRSKFINLITNTNFIYNPYLIAMGSVAYDMINPEMVMIGTEDGNENGQAKKLIDFYKTMMGNDPRYVVGTWDECEAIKVFYNTMISAKIGIVNMIQDVAIRLGNINVDVVTKALADSDKRITGPQYMVAGMGDAGACHPRDNIALKYLAQDLDLGYDLFGAIMDAREIQAKNLADTLVYHAKKNDMDIIIHGVAYKPNVPYTEGSYSLLIGHYIERAGIIPKYVDPMTGDNFAPTEPSVFLLAHNAEITYKYTGKQQNFELYCDIPDGSIVIDPWRQYENDVCEVVHYGNSKQCLNLK